MRRSKYAGILLVLIGCLLAGTAGAAPSTPEYTTQFRVDIRPAEPKALAEIRVVQSGPRLKRLQFRMPQSSFSLLDADGKVTRDGERVTWEVPAKGGSLRYRVVVDHKRNEKGYDALITERWALFRADDVFPRAKSTHQRGARGRGELVLAVPTGWTSVTPYLPDTTGRLRFISPTRSFSRPVGWILAGSVGARMDVIGPTMVRIAAPRGDNVQRVSMLSLVRGVLPILQAELSGLPGYVLIVSAGDPMWRGGLSAPNSIYLHSGRPVIGENGTSTLIHELLHVLAPVPTVADQDWIDEGVAEYLGLVLLRRSGAISPERFDHAIDIFRRQGARVTSMTTRNSRGDVNARAVVVFHDLDLELQRRTAGRADIFELVRRLMAAEQPVDIIRLRAIAMDMAGDKPLQSLLPPTLPGN
jgi:hypothetical protein